MVLGHNNHDKSPRNSNQDVYIVTLGDNSPFSSRNTLPEFFSTTDYNGPPTLKFGWNALFGWSTINPAWQRHRKLTFSFEEYRGDKSLWGLENHCDDASKVYYIFAGAILLSSSQRCWMRMDLPLHTSVLAIYLVVQQIAVQLARQIPSYKCSFSRPQQAGILWCGTFWVHMSLWWVLGGPYWSWLPNGICEFPVEQRNRFDSWRFARTERELCFYQSSHLQSLWSIMSHLSSRRAGP